MEFKNTGRNKVLYQGLWGNSSSLEGEIEPNPAKEVSSYKFKGNSNNVCEIVKNFYGIYNEDLFSKQYEKAVSGNGDEQKKILTLHSSSRLALLTFYNVTDDNPLTLEIDGESIRFDYSTFEFKNPVIGYPSNMDVVLVSHEKNVVLFLESKFAEYYLYASHKSREISSKYAENRYGGCFYDASWLRKLEIEKNDLPEGQFELSSNAKDNRWDYLDGFKQMISHYIGVRRRLDDKDQEKDKEYDNDSVTYKEVLDIIGKPESKVYLGEILFDEIPDGSNRVPHPKDVLETYGELYSNLAKKMNEEIDKAGLRDKFKVLDEHLKYSDILNSEKTIHSFEPKIFEFYGMHK